MYKLLADPGIPERKQQQHLQHAYTSTQTVNTRLSIWRDKHHLEDKSLAFLEMFNWGETHSEHVQHQPMGGVSEWAEMWKGGRHQAPSLSASWLWMQPDLVSSGSLPISTLGPQCWGYRSMELFWLFMWVLGIGSRVLTLAEEASYPLNYLSLQAPGSTCRLTKPYTKHLTSHSQLCSSWEPQFHLLALSRHLT